MPNAASHAREAAEIVVGLGVLGFQRAQVERRQLMKRMEGTRSEAETAVEGLRSEMSKRVAEADRFLSPLLGRVEAGLSRVEHTVPDAGREAVRRSTAQARATAHELKHRLFN